MGSTRRSMGLLPAGLLALGLSACATAGTPPTPPPPPPPTEDPFQATPCDTKAHKNDIEVGATVGCKLAMVPASSPDAKDKKVRWRATDQNLNVKIVFTYVNPFKTMDCDGTKRMCTAQDINVPGGDMTVYLYTASLCDKNGVCTLVTDPGIIIHP
jgi:hypothetical protein